MSDAPTLLLEEKIKNADYRQATELFCNSLKSGDLSMQDAVRSVIGVTAPYIQVPSHQMQLPDGRIRGVNYDHTVLGWRAALRIMPEMSKKQMPLAAVQAMWYVPQALNIWEQIACEFPGHYANHGEGCNRRLPGPDPEVNRFDGPAWNPPKIDFVDSGEVITDGAPADRLDRLTWAIAEGNRQESYGLFLGLAEDLEHREALKEHIVFAGIIDLQDTITNRGGYQNMGHKALRARALIDIADYVGWENAHDVIYTVVPDLGCAPRLHGLWSEISAITGTELGGRMPIAKRALPLTDRQLDQLTEAILWGGPAEVNDVLTAAYKGGCGIIDLADAVVVAGQRYFIDVVEHPNAFARPTHAADYCNVVNNWLRNYDNQHQVKGPYMMARFINDTVRYNALYAVDPDSMLESRHVFRAWADSVPLKDLLHELGHYVLAQDAPRSAALVDSYLDRTNERTRLIRAIVDVGCHFQNDPHIMRNCASSIEEFNYNQTSRKDDILRGFVKFQSRYVKRARSHDAYELYKRHFDSETAVA